MFEPSSRYSGVSTARLILSDGGSVSYVRRRFVPPADSLPPLAKITVTEGDRLDLIAGRTLGDSEQFWQVCDANEAMKPNDLLEESGKILRVPMPQFR